MHGTHRVAVAPQNGAAQPRQPRVRGAEASLALSPITAGTSTATAAPRQAAALATSPAGNRPSTTTAQRTATARVASSGWARNSRTQASTASTASTADTPHIEGSPLLRRVDIGYLRATQRRSKKVRQEASMPKLSPVDRVLLTELQ